MFVCPDRCVIGECEGDFVQSVQQTFAAERAEQAWAYPEAVASYEDALSLIPKDDDRRRSIGLRRTVAGIRHEHTVMEEEQLKRLAADGSA